MVAPAAIPELREELDRKTFETVEWLLQAHARGAISDPQFSTGMDALWMAVSGLVDESFVAIATEAGKITRGVGAHRLRRHFISGANVITLSWTAGESHWEYQQHNSGARKFSGTKDAVDPLQAREQMARFAQKLLATGFTEL